MTEASFERLIGTLTEELAPVVRLASPIRRALIWIAVVAAVALVLAAFCDLAQLGHRLQSVPDMWLAVLGSTLTAVLGAVATFELSLPDRSARWALLPLPGIALWISATGMGCLRVWVSPDLHAASFTETQDCFVFIVGVSIPLSILTIAMIRRAFPMRPNLTAAAGGTAVAAAAASLLNFFHPYDVGVLDIAVHAAAIGLVIAANQVFGGRLLSPKSRP